MAIKEIKREDKLPNAFALVSGVKVTIDPHGKYKGIPNRALYDACGFLPEFISGAAMSDPKDAEEFVQLVRDFYGFSLGGNWLEQGDGTLLDNGTYRYEGDPDLHPYVQFLVPTADGFVEAYVYEYGYFAAQKGDFQWLERMD